MKKRKKITLPNINYSMYGACLLIGLLLITIIHLYCKCSSLRDEITDNKKTFSTEYSDLSSKYNTLQDEVTARRKVYIYNLEEILTKTDIVETKKKFEESLIKLNDELNDGKKRIKTLRDARIKEDFSKIYINNLRAKRDELVTDYDKKLDELADKINKALAELCAEKNIPTIFFHNMIAVNTDDVIDVTDEIIEKIKQQ